MEKFSTGPEDIEKNNSLYSRASRLLKDIKIPYNSGLIIATLTLKKLLLDADLSASNDDSGDSYTHGFDVIHGSIYKEHIKETDSIYFPGIPFEDIKGGEQNIFRYFFDSAPVLHAFLILFPKNHSLYPDGVLAEVKNIYGGERGHGAIILPSGVVVPDKLSQIEWISDDDRRKYREEHMKHAQSIFQFLTSVFEEGRFSYAFKRNIPLA